MMKIKEAVIGAALLAAAANVGAVELQRGAWLGAQISPGEGGVQIGQVLPGGSAEQAGIQEGDLIVDFNNEGFADIQEFVQILSSQRAEDELTFSIKRGDDDVTLTTNAVARPMEQSDEFEIIYDAVQIDDEIYRSIVTKPNGDGPFPTIYYIQGYNCATIDWASAPPTHPITSFLYNLTRDGYATYRIEKRGMGDSIGEPCSEMGLNDEIVGFQAGLAAVKHYDFVDSDQLFVFGHSMGGIVGPAIAANDDVSGLILYGTGGKTWMEYNLENHRRQMTLGGTDYVEQDETIRQLNKFDAAYFVHKMSPTEIKEHYPELTEYVDTVFQDPTHMYGRHYTFWQEVYDSPVVKNLRDAETPVLALWGEADFVSTKSDHEFIAEVVDFYHPGKGEFQVVDNSDHIFFNHEDMPSSMASFPGGDYNPEVESVVKDWIARVTASESGES